MNTHELHLPRRNGLTIRDAIDSDNDALLELTRLTPMQGLIGLRIDRDPDFFRLFRARGPGKCIVADEEGAIVGSISVNYRRALICGNPERIGYVADLKVHPSRRRSRVAYYLMRAAFEYAKNGDADIFLCLVAGGNAEALPVLRGAAGIPPFQSIGRFVVNAIIPWPAVREPRGYVIRESRDDEQAEMVTFVNRFYSTYDLAPDTVRGNLIQTEIDHSMRADQALVALHLGRITAVIIPLDTGEMKENVVVSMPAALRVASAALSGFGRIMPLMRPPRLGEPLRMLYVRHFACDASHHIALRHLVQRLRYDAYARRYSLVILALHERDGLQRALRAIPRFTFSSYGFALSLSGRRDVLTRLQAGVAVEDFSLV